MTVSKYKMGPGTLKLNVARTETISTTSGDATITGGAGTFSATDVGAAITGTGIPGGTTILSVTSDTEAELSANATATGAGVTATLTPTGGEVSLSCQITQAVVAWSDDTGDTVAVLCGDEVAGDTTWTASLSGTMFQDLDVVVPWTWTNKGKTVSAVFIPSTAEAKQVVGNLMVKPLDVGGEVKTSPTSDFEWPFIGEPELVAVTP